MTEKRKDIAPPVVALLPLSGEVDVQQLWNLILGGFQKPRSDGKQHSTRGGEAMDDDAIAGPSEFEQTPELFEPRCISSTHHASVILLHC